MCVLSPHPHEITQSLQPRGTSYSKVAQWQRGRARQELTGVQSCQISICFQLHFPNENIIYTPLFFGGKGMGTHAHIHLWLWSIPASKNKGRSSLSARVTQWVTGSMCSSALTLQEKMRRARVFYPFLSPTHTHTHFLIPGLGYSYYCMNEWV